MTSFGKTFLYSIFAGVLQGCPMSATLFILAIDPFLIHFEQALSGKYEGIVRACADDVGIALADFRSLEVVEKVFHFAKECANMCLKPKKCNIIPLNPASPTQLDGTLERDLIKSWLISHIPHWQDFCVCLSAKYLGFGFGPEAMAKQWTAPMKTL